MSNLSNTNLVINQPQIDVSIAGNRVSTVICQNISGDSASFEAPAFYFEDKLSSIQNKFIQVDISQVTAGSSGTVFAGIIDVTTAMLSASGERISFTAKAITSYLDRVYIGQNCNIPNVTYSKNDVNKYTPSRVLKHIFNEDMPSDFKGYVKLGDTSILDDSEVGMPKTLQFSNTSIISAIDQLIGYFGDVAYTQRYVGTTCYLDFYRIQNPNAPLSVVRIANGNPMSGNVQEINNTTTGSATVNRIKVFGNRKQYVITVRNYDEDPEKNLIKDWNIAFEPYVLANPSIVKPGAPGYVQGMEFVFRRFKLPVVLQKTFKFDNLPFKRKDGESEYNPQAFGFFSQYTSTEADEAGKLNATVKEIPDIIDGVTWDLQKNNILFKEPQLNEMQCWEADTTVSDTSAQPINVKNVIKKSYLPRNIAVTIAVGNNDEYLFYDTGVDKNSDLQVFASGTTEQITKEDYRFAQLTGQFGDKHFHATLFNVDDNTIIINETANVFIDDTDKCKTLALKALQVRNKSHRQYEITIPYITRAYRVGNRLRIENLSNFPQDNFMITSVSFDFTGNSTTISIDNVKPNYTQEAL